MRIKSLLVFAVALLAASPASAAPLAERDRAAIEAMEQRLAPLPRAPRGTAPAPLARRMAEAKVAAVSIAFIEDGRVTWTRAYGEAEAGSGRKVTPATLFQGGSISKAVTAAGALRLVERGRLSLDGDVAPRLRGWRLPPGQAAAAGPVTLRQLLSHTAGLTVSAYPGYLSGEPVPTLLQSLAGTRPAKTAPVRRFAAPGGATAYSGGGYSVAQLLMTEATGTPFARLMRRLLLAPLGMTRSSFDHPLPRAARAGAAFGHDEQGRPLPGGGAIYPELASAGLWTTPADYGRFLIALQDSWAGRRGAFLKPASARAMMSPVQSDYGLGVTVVERGGRPVITHGGANEGFECRFTAWLDGSRQGLVVMTNGQYGGALAAAVQRTLAQAYGWDDTSVPPTPRAPES